MYVHNTQDVSLIPRNACLSESNSKSYVLCTFVFLNTRFSIIENMCKDQRGGVIMFTGNGVPVIWHPFTEQFLYTPWNYLIMGGC